MAQQKKHGSKRQSQEQAATRAPKRRQEAPGSATPTLNERLRRGGKWIFLALAVVFAFGFVFAGIGTGGGLSLADLIGQRQNSSPAQTTAASDSAVQKAEAAAKKAPDDPQAWLDFAQAAVAAGQLDKVADAARKASELAPDDATVQEGVADVYLAEAAAALQKAQTEYAKAQGEGTVNGRAPLPQQVIPGQANGIDAFQTAQQAIQSSVLSAASTKVQPLQTQADEAYKAAVAAQEAVTKAKADDPAAWFRLAQIQTAANDAQGAIDAYRKFIALAPEDPLVTKVKDEIKRLQDSLNPAAATTTGG